MAWPTDQIQLAKQFCKTAWPAEFGLWEMAWVTSPAKERLLNYYESIDGYHFEREYPNEKQYGYMT